jgi:hypothetical protein
MHRRFLVFFLASGCAAMLGQGVLAQREVQPVAPQPGVVQPGVVFQVQQAQVQQAIQVRGGVVAGQAMMIRQQGSGLQTFAKADAVFVGRVVGLEPMDVEAAPAPGQAKVKYSVAVVQISEVLHGLKKDVKMVRIGFIGAGNVNPGFNPGANQFQPAIQPAFPGGGIRRLPGIANVTLQVGQDGLFTVNKHAQEDFYLLPNYTSFVSSQNNANFENEVNTAKQLCKVVEDTTAALKSDDQQQRFLAAALLIGKYRSSAGFPAKLVPIDAAESKLILKALATSDWTAPRTGALVPTSMEVFNQLGVTAADGYKLVNIRQQQDIPQAMQKWLGENSEKYVIKQYVSDPNAKANPGVAVPPVVRPVPGAFPNGRAAPPLQVQPGQAQPLPPVPPVPAVPRDQ